MAKQKETFLVSKFSRRINAICTYADYPSIVIDACEKFSSACFVQHHPVPQGPMPIPESWRQSYVGGVYVRLKLGDNNTYNYLFPQGESRVKEMLDEGITF
jgi:hypothetical protein